jgi:hypothetical protein
MSREVHLYVGTTRYQNITTSVVNNFFQSVTNAGGVCESGQCMVDYLEGLGGLFGYYENSERLELFNDETINLTSTVQNVQDISKTFTDFSQSFTIPANDHNNRILQHFYQSDVNALFDYNLRLDSFIEIDLTFFRRGKLQVEKANLKNGRPESYTVTFYGDGRTLKDYFGEDLLSDLDYTAISHFFTSDDVLDRIQDNTNLYDVKYPLITSNRIWEYQSAAVNAPFPNWLTAVLTQNDIHTNSGAIYKTELFPAVRVSKIFDAIASKYGITFDSTFLTDERFTKLFLWFKGKETLVTTSLQEDVNLTSVAATFTTYDLTSYVNTTNDTITVQFIDSSIFNHKLVLNVNSVTSASTYYVDVYQNGNLLNSISGTGTGAITLDSLFGVIGLNSEYTFKMRGDGSNTLGISLTYSVSYLLSNVLETDFVDVTCSNVTVSSWINLSANAPQMKVADFFTGILKAFNMVCVGTGLNTYQVEPLDAWYGQGAIVDITEDTDIASIDVARMPLYKKIQFKFADSECLLNKFFSQTFNRNYGDTTYQYNYDGGEFTVELPFENLLQTKFNGTQELQLGYSLNSEFAPYIPKPVLLYQYDNQVSNFKFSEDGGGGHATVTTYTPFGQDLRYNNTDLTLNFAPETSTLLEYPIQQTGFAQYYFGYLYNLYNLKQRLVTVKTILPVGILTSLKLNDRLIIRDKRYIINDMNTNLTTGEVQFSLYLDFRPMINKVPFINIPASGGSAVTAINIPNGGITALLTPSAADIALSQTTLTASQNVTITTGTLTSGSAYSIDVRFDYANGTQTNDNIFIVIE